MMYRAYQPLLPTTNRYLQEKWDKANYLAHRRKVKLAVPIVNTRALPTPVHLQVNQKKIQLEKERQATWDRENLLHYAKLWGIQQSRGRVDNWNFYCTHSLNWEKRLQDLVHICEENQQLVKRLEGRKSGLARGLWQQDWHKEQLIRNRIAHYPRGPRSCLARKEKPRLWTGSSSTPASPSGDSPSTLPNRTHVPCSKKNYNNVLGKSSWGSRSESTAEVPATTSSPSSLRGRDVLQPPGAVTQQSRKGIWVSTKDRDADGSLARKELPGEGSLEKPLAEMMATIKPPTSLGLGEELKPSENSQKKPELSARKATLRYRRTEGAPRFDGQAILLTPVSVKSEKSLPRKSEPTGDGCGRHCPVSPSASGSCSSLAGLDKGSPFLAKVCGSRSSNS
ncbi:uncharacterized protein LOC128334928 [Hemicordylus capensis]|uniref:uncharacterized protein LOC128334928 n=1 Tax=Hemicordylus capensis TaxID=884348 RepID=UPI00230419CB|nr:uncharacterized protein LOC128334928 [Hemicordylus capensis]